MACRATRLASYDRHPKLSRVSIPVVGWVPDAILQSKLTV